ncbi:MAG: hypothetical protein EAX86_01025 [Candidatus Heimdallarchaeota archaeon]|nr:hypothetical protein [Candidatus Heimdallarchaeota archaeon]
MDPILFLIIIALSWITLNSVTKIQWLKLKNPEIGLGYAYYRTTKLNSLINQIAQRGKKIWRFIWDVGVISGLGILIIGLIIFTLNIPLFFLQTPDSTNAPIAVTPVIPGITVSFQSLPYFLVAIMIGAIAHEFGHGIAARVEDVKLKSTGIFVFLVFFGAFVEPDENSIKTKSRRSILRITSAGALANMVIAMITLAILIVPIGFPILIAPFYKTESSGALIIETISDNPAQLAGLKPGYAIIAIESAEGITEISSATDFHIFTNTSVLPNQNLTFYFANKIDPISLQTVPREDNPSKGFIGIRTWEYFEPNFLEPSSLANLIPYWIFNTILYVFMLNLMFALMNLLPIPFLDGDRLLNSFLGPKYGKYTSFIRYFALGVLGLNLLLSLLVTGWQPI